ncbi:SURF1 family protein [Labedella gwakjiensis]|uniref:SURF1-like protein n=1 Tax=Labedella gwakjiensis TaxID=390269 RepID=A0A2P8GRU1_9MICO|nr:SURF1 family cytochrome oxidase biogenesis protein [Labedella gwakjiensis]PSL36686.1 SURF1 family protein [Labedella gwakjiensis]RUQ84207.1 SURF1 family protein [Labedella gwakjiensis]
MTDDTDTEARIVPDTPLWRTLVRPRWIALLALALVVAGAFAALGHWQLSRAVESSDTGTVAGVAETPTPLADVLEAPTDVIRTDDVGRLVEVEGVWVEGDFLVISERVNDGPTGWWVAGHLATGADGTGPSLAVAMGWTDDEDVARQTAAAWNAGGAPDGTVELTGRIVDSEAPIVPDEQGDPHEMTTLSEAALINIWQPTASPDIYSVNLISAEAPSGLEKIYSPRPESATTVNWLNIFYAVEWVVFAGFAVYFWYRLGRDAWEREAEEKALVEVSGP